MAVETLPQFRIPHLLTALAGPLFAIEKHFIRYQVQIEAWLRYQWRLTPAPLTCSVDLRNAGYKIAPIDTNLFPAGFNNLNPDFLPLCIQAMQNTLENTCPDSLRVMIIPENHTRNMFYFESLAVLTAILTKAGILVRIGSLAPDIQEPKTFTLPSGKTLTLEPVHRQGNRLLVGDFDPCFILLNHDLSEGIPTILQDLDQNIRPALNLGWSTRLKSEHFRHYAAVTAEFSKIIDLDPWLITPYFDQCDEVDFAKRTGEGCVMSKAEALFEKIRTKYHEYGIEQKPYIVVKANSGTYGRGVMTIDNVEQLQNLNRQQRKEMAAGKGNLPITKVILQEGVYTQEQFANATAEPVVYMLGNHVVGGFYRVHEGRGNDENLNSPGMHFKPLAFAHCCNNPSTVELDTADPDHYEQSHHHENRFYSYGVVARLALLAAAREA